MTALLAGHGFVPVDLESVSFIEIMSLFYHAKAIVGLDGSAFANMLFAREGAKVLNIFPDIGAKRWLPLMTSEDSEQIMNRDFYANLHLIVNVEYKVWEQPTVLTPGGQRHVHVDLQDLDNVIRLFFGPP